MRLSQLNNKQRLDISEFNNCSKWQGKLEEIMTRKNDTWITASEVGMASICEQKVYFKSIGKNQSDANNELMKKGTMMHQKASGEYRSTKKESPSSCYIATCVYGCDHEITNLLRNYRDTQMVKSIYGRAFIRVYYLVSPCLVRMFGESAIFRNLSRRLISVFIKIFVRRK